MTRPDGYVAIMLATTVLTTVGALGFAVVTSKDQPAAPLIGWLIGMAVAAGWGWLFRTCHFKDEQTARAQHQQGQIRNIRS